MKRVLSVSILGFLFFSLAGCSGGGDGVIGSSGGATTVAATNPPVKGPAVVPATNLGTLVIQLPLVNTRAVKAEVSDFRVNLSQNGQVVITRDVQRSQVSSQQEIRVENVPLGVYQVEVLYLNDIGLVVGTYKQDVTVDALESLVLVDPAYQNTVPDFKAPSFFPGGYYASWVALDDFNEDGLQDLVSTEWTVRPSDDRGRLFVNLGKGNGNFQTAVELFAGKATYFVTTADINEDGHRDLLSANTTDLSLLLGNGDGTFADAVTFPLHQGAVPRAIKAVDINGDGHLDLVTANIESDDASVLLGHGDGTFEDERWYPVGEDPYDVLLVDVDGDRVLDLVAGPYTGDKISLLLGEGDGTFGEARYLQAGLGPSSLGTGDFNHDGHPDLVSTDTDANTVSVFLSDGEGGFKTPVAYQVGEYPVYVALADINGDGELDMVVPNWGSLDISVLLGHSDGTFSSESRIDWGRVSFTLSLVDVNRDGHLDIVGPDLFGGSILVLKGNGDGTFDSAPPQIDGESYPLAVKTADFNGDGKLDLAAVYSQSTQLTLVYGNGDGTFSDPVKFETGAEMRDLEIADFNGDKVLDVVASSDTGAIYLPGKTDGTFGSAISLFDQITTQVHVLDFNGDGLLDVALAREFSNEVVMLLGKGDGSFAQPSLIDAGVKSVRFDVGDFNQDKIPDLAVLGYTETVYVSLGKGDGSFEAAVPLPVDEPNGGTVHIDVKCDDVNLDGIDDIIVPQSNSGTVSVALGVGDGTFQEVKVSQAGSGADRLLSQDITGDGFPDLVSTYISFLNRFPGVSVQVGNGDGTYGEPYFFYAGGQTQSTAIGDFNSDGAPDLVVTSPLSGRLNVLLAR